MKPRLVHPITITLYKREESPPDAFGDKTAMTELLFMLKGQLSPAKYDRMRQAGGGNDPEAEGHVIFMASDWAAVGGEIGDELVLPGSASRLIVVEVMPCGTYGGTAWMVKVGYSRKRASI